MKLLVLTVALLGLLAVACHGTAVLDESFNVRVGDCIAPPSYGAHTSMRHVSCSLPGAMRVVGIFDVAGYSSWPGHSVLESQAHRYCPLEATDVFGPTKESWEQVGDREIVCLADAGH